jgi:hypothetical protein
MADLRSPGPPTAAAPPPARHAAGSRSASATTCDRSGSRAAGPAAPPPRADPRGCRPRRWAAPGAGGGLRTPGIEPPPRPAAPVAGTRSRRSGNGSGAPARQGPIAPGTTAASVLTGELRNQIDRIWDAFWSGGITDTMEVLRQLTYLLFMRRLDELKTLEEAQLDG